MNKSTETFSDYRCTACRVWYRMSKVPGRQRGDDISWTGRFKCNHKYEIKLIAGIPEFQHQTYRPKSNWRTFAGRLGAKLVDLATPIGRDRQVCDVCGLPPYLHPTSMRHTLHITNEFQPFLFDNDERLSAKL